MKFSVLIPVYNTQKYLDRCMESVLNQTYKDFEVILVDDGSTDNSGKLCDSYAKIYTEKVTVIHQNNRGPLCSRINAMNSAKGEFCIFIDSDDFIDYNLLDVINGYVNYYDNVDVVLYSFYYYNNGKKAKRFKSIAGDKTIWYGDAKRELYEKLAFSNDITPMWIKAVKTSLLKSDPTDYSVYYGKNIAEDLLQSLYIITAAKKIIYADIPLYCYNVISGSVSHSFLPESLYKKNTIHVYNKVLEYFSKWGILSDENKNRLSAIWLNNMIWEFLNCYECAKSKGERKKVISADWISLLPEDCKNTDNAFVGEQTWRLYNALKNKNRFLLSWIFTKNRWYKKWGKLLNK